MALRTPEFLQTKTYSAMRDRLALQHGGPVQAGVWDAGDFKATQRAAGANMSVDVAAGFALVPANDPGNAGLYHVQNDATFNVTLQTNGTAWAVGSGTNPRIDRVVLLVSDTTDGGDSSDTPTIAVVQGTATAGATLDNLTGAAAIPNGALLLADVLMPTSSTTVTTANIRDRRAWARGADFINPVAGTINTTSAPVAITSTPRVECSGKPIDFFMNVPVSNTVGGSYSILMPWIDGAEWSGGGSRFYQPNPITNISGTLHALLALTPTAGSHTFAWVGAASANTSQWFNAGVGAWGVREHTLPGNTSNT